MSPSNAMQPQTYLQQPKPAHLSTSSQDIVSEQPIASKHSMELARPTMTTAEPKVSMRGGGVIGDCVDAIVCFECCKGCCDCCC